MDTSDADMPSSSESVPDVPKTTDADLLSSSEFIPALPSPLVQNSRPVRERRQTVWHSMLTILHGHPEPSSYQEAITSTEAFLWQKAMEEEYNSLIENGTWVLTELPQDRSVIKSRWVYKLKPSYLNLIPARYKARFVAKGYSQKQEIDYKETFAPVVKHDSLRVVLSLVAAYDLEMLQLDVTTAFLHGELAEEIYIEQPEGFIKPGHESSVCCLKKCLYGLKQSPRIWNQKFNSFLVKYGLQSSTADPCVYIGHGSESDDFTIVAIWVDDGLVCSRTKTRNDLIVKYLTNHFKMSSGPADRFIGLKITRIRSEKKLFVCQSLYIEKLLEIFNMQNCIPKTVPAEPGSRLTVKDSPTTVTEQSSMSSTPYRQAVGSLMYAMIMTRPDIAFAVGQVSRFSVNPGPVHWEAVKRILSYLAGTPKHGLCFTGTDLSNQFLGYSDSDYAGCPDTRISTTGTLFILNGGPISWKSRIQKPVACSSTEAEYYAAGDAAREAVWLRLLLENLNSRQTEPSPLFCDNQSTIRLIQNPEFHDRTKHIAVKFHYIRQVFSEGKIAMFFIPTTNNLADIFTKALPSVAFTAFRTAMGVIAVPPSNI